MRCPVCGSSEVAKASLETSAVGSRTQDTDWLPFEFRQVSRGCGVGLLSFFAIMFLGGALVAQILYGRTDNPSGSFIVGMFWFSLVSSVLIGIASAQRMRRVQRKQVGDWLHTWVCRQCGHAAPYVNFQ